MGMRSWLRAGAVCFLGSALASCSSEYPLSGTEHEASAISQAVTLPVQFTVSALSATSVPDTFISATSSLLLDARVEVGASGQIVPIVSFGAEETQLANGVKVHANVSSSAAVFLGGGQAVVDGFLKSGSIITAQADSIVAGGKLENQVIPRLEFTWDVAWPSTHGGDVVLTSGATVIPDLAPGAYGQVALSSGRKMKLRTGVYFFDSIAVEPQAEVEVDNVGGPVLIYVKDAITLKGLFKELNGQRGQLLIGYAGAGTVYVEPAFLGTIVAPQGTIELRRPTDNAPHEGAFFGKKVHVFSDSKIKFLPFDWSYFCRLGNGTIGIDCPETYTVSIPKPTTIGLADLAILGKEVILGAGVRVLDVSTERPAHVAATGNAGLVVGDGAVAGGVQSAGGITLGAAAKVGAVLEANSTISGAESAWWGGSRIAAPDVVQIELRNAEITWPDESGGALSVLPNQVSAPAPGRYDAVTVPANATLKLASGAYYFDSLALLPGSALVYANLTGPVRVFLRGGLKYQGAESRAADRANILFVSFGTDAIDISSAFRGTIWAPEADILLAATATGHRGSFVGNRIAVPPNTPILHEPYVTRQCIGDKCGEFMPSQCQAGSDFIRKHPITVEQSAANSPYWGWYASFNVLEDAQDWVCFLTRIGGDLGSVSPSRNPRHGARYVGGKVLGATVEKKNDYWVGSVGYDVSAEATCVHRSCFSNNVVHNSGPYFVDAEATNGIPIIEGCKADTQGKPAGLFDEATFLTKFDPWEPSGGGERGWVVQHASQASEIKASDQQCDSTAANNQGERVRAVAHAFRAGPLNLPALFDGPDATSSTIDHAGKFGVNTAGPDRNSKKVWLAPVRTSVCYLSSISGKFAGGGEFATVTMDLNLDAGEEYWQLYAQHQSGGAPSGVQAEATCYARDQDRCQTAEASDLPECQALLKQSFTWSQNQARREMGSAADRACLLTEVRGSFKGGGEEIRVHIDSGVWVLDGKSQQGGLRGKVQCVSTTSFTDEQSWRQGEERVLLGSADGRACFLTRITGHFEGGGERLRVYIEDGNWYLHGQSQQLSVGGSARCIPAESLTEPVSWNQGEEPVTLTADPSDPRDVCFLTMVKGRFEGGGESVAVTSVPGASGGLVQQLGGHSLQEAVGATAMCARLPRSIKVGSPEAPPAPERDCTLVSTTTDFYGAPDEQDRVCFMVHGAGYGSESMTTGYACRPRSCYRGNSHDLTAQLPTINQKEGEDPNCGGSTKVPLTKFDSVGYLFNVTGNFAGFGESVRIEQATAPDTFSNLVISTCQDYVGGAARTLTLGTRGQAIKFMGAGDTVGGLLDVGGFEVDTTLGQTSAIMTPFDTTTCVVTSVSGTFNGGGERFDLSSEVVGGIERWKLSAQKQSGNGIRVGARCFLNLQNP